MNSRDCIGEVMRFVQRVLEEARFAYVIDELGVERIREKLTSASADARYAVIVHYNEYLSSQEFTVALSSAHPSMQVSPR